MLHLGADGKVIPCCKFDPSNPDSQHASTHTRTHARKNQTYWLGYLDREHHIQDENNLKPPPRSVQDEINKIRIIHFSQERLSHQFSVNIRIK